MEARDFKPWAKRKLAGHVINPGSRGGNVIGTTRSGNPIYGPRTEDVKALREMPKMGKDPANTLVNGTRPIRVLEDHAVKGAQDFSSAELKDAEKAHIAKAAEIRAKVAATGGALKTQQAEYNATLTSAPTGDQPTLTKAVGMGPKYKELAEAHYSTKNDLEAEANAHEVMAQAMKKLRVTGFPWSSRKSGFAKRRK